MGHLFLKGSIGCEVLVPYFERGNLKVNLLGREQWIYGTHTLCSCSNEWSRPIYTNM